MFPLPKMFNRVFLSPLSWPNIDKLHIGMRAELNEEVMYPFRLFDDIGCGTIVGILPEDFETDKDIDKIIDEVLEEEYRDPELDKLLPDLSLYTGDLTSTMVEVNRKVKESNSNDPWLKEGIPLIKEKLNEDQLKAVEILNLQEGDPIHIIHSTGKPER